ncbi:MAG: hypothetical protein IK005_02350 [Paludibacteraceae bacterium]|nr:hypothetical protein [Paludibacteraceae bacterium]MBR4839300.1 hypothetical protein [Paludibacteraceae bacterium]
MVRYIKIAIALVMIAAAYSSCKSSSCGCDSFGEVMDGQVQESTNA